jgi:hypothetical protein
LFDFRKNIILLESTHNPNYQGKSFPVQDGNHLIISNQFGQSVADVVVDNNRLIAVDVVTGEVRYFLLATGEAERGWATDPRNSNDFLEMCQHRRNLTPKGK